MSYQLQPGCPTIIVTPTTLPNGTKGYDYIKNVSASSSSGTTDFRYYISSKLGLPDGLSLNNFNGQIFGKFLTSGNYTFTIAASSRAELEDTCIGTQEYTIIVI